MSIKHTINELHRFFEESTQSNTSTGLTFVPKSSADATRFKQALNNSDYHYEWDAREGYFFFPEEESNYDTLESELQSIVDENDVHGHFEGIWLDEMSTTANVPGYQTPKAFGTADDDTVEQFGMKKIKKTNKIFKPMESKSIYKKMMSEMHGVNEAVSYRDYKRDESASPVRKVNNGIQEVNAMLAEIEKIVHNNLRLKTEMGVNSSQFWKKTSGRINKINERIVRISNKLKELSK